MVLAGIETIFFPVAGRGPGFGFRMRIALITQWCLGIAEQGLQSQGHFSSSHCPASQKWGAQGAARRLNQHRASQFWTQLPAGLSHNTNSALLRCKDTSLEHLPHQSLCPFTCPRDTQKVLTPSLIYQWFSPLQIKPMPPCSFWFAAP